MLKKLFKTKYVPFEAKYIALTVEDERNIRISRSGSQGLSLF